MDRPVIRTFKDLRVWQNAMALAMSIFEQTKSFPSDERYSMSDQIRRSSRSMAANIAEAWRKRRYEAAFIAKLSDSEPEAAETQTWIELALRCQYISKESAADLDAKCEEILGQLVAMINHSDQWIIRKEESGRGEAGKR